MEGRGNLLRVTEEPNGPVADEGIGVIEGLKCEGVIETTAGIDGPKAFEGELRGIVRENSRWTIAPKPTPLHPLA